MASASGDICQIPESCENKNLSTAKEAVTELYNFRDTFFASHGIEQASNKKKLLSQELDKTVAVLRSFQKDIGHLAEYHLLLGKAFNVKEEFHQEALNHLSRAVKLDPKLTEAWTQLGECYWLKGDVSGAHNCFLGALSHGTDKVALRSLSMAVRQLPGTPDEQKMNTQASVDKAKEAVTLDMNDGMSWYILGNAYLAQFFKHGQDPRVLQQCTVAYEKAGRDKRYEHYPDLHFNRGVVHKYKEEYELALKEFSTASTLDPDWEEASTNLNTLVRYLNDVQRLLETKGKVKTKKLQSWLSRLGDHELGPYAGGQYTNGKQVVNLSRVSFSELNMGMNENKVVVGRVIGLISTEEKTPFVFGLVDCDSTCCSVTVYNMTAQNGIRSGDSVAIPEPFLDQVNFSHSTKTWNFKTIRIMHPVVIVLNGRKLGPDSIALTSFSSNVQTT